MTGTIKISKRGFDVEKKHNKIVATNNAATPIRMYSPMILIFLNGAKKQVQRYCELSSNYEKNKTIGIFIDCLHEIFTLFEDLATLGKYLEKCGDTTRNNEHKLWFDIRNHIRHDIREEFDKEDDERKNKRAKKLDLDPSLQMDINCRPDKIKIGSTVVDIKKINAYLKWVETFNKDIWDEAVKNGFIDTVSKHIN